ncbi:capsular polysaccharide biosynthesis protein [Pararhizobium sp. YC-54]|uniref:capsular polysaccharide export protein, LipB/KpsS family n=1 Tax=Pararhizobium sp. YC-54 TaxID=2986920 RepID=UPI0021F6F30C|nr:capsular polysaccharide biosynthesis protein [Pararhizobium sp. YC-54]MCV9998936.1 capsular polysaccharide biosynthesis protein [Pararhizobium sp. YC-54]
MKKAFFFGFAPWKDYLPRWFFDRRCVAVSRKRWVILCEAWPLRILLARRAEVYVWGFKYPPFLKTFCKLFRIPFRHVEDGFVRSVSLGAYGSAPASLTVDSRTPYFDATKPSDLEVILSTYDFAGDDLLMQRAERGMDLLMKNRISKYNLGVAANIPALYGHKDRKRVLVIGQVETDASIRLGCDRAMTNNDLVRFAAQENPDAQVIYKPHPEVLHGTRAGVSDPADVADICVILREDIAPADAFETIDHVYTITSLMGFEALLRGKRVTCFGLPFYAGWGLTDDRQTNPRRRRKLTIGEIFAASYLLYPRYFDPATGAPSSFEATIKRLHDLQNANPSTDDALPSKNASPHSRD